MSAADASQQGYHGGRSVGGKTRAERCRSAARVPPLRRLWKRIKRPLRC